MQLFCVPGFFSNPPADLFSQNEFSARIRSLPSTWRIGFDASISIAQRRRAGVLVYVSAPCLAMLNVGTDVSFNAASSALELTS